MKQLRVGRCSAFGGEVTTVAPDKSISHRVAMFSLLSESPATVENFLRAEDTLCSLSIAAQLGAKVSWVDQKLVITPPSKVNEPSDILNCGNAGTAMRLYIGLLSAQEGFFVLSGDKYLNARPMKRVVDPLTKIGAKIDGRFGGNFAPIAVRGNENLSPFDYQSPIASAQVKSALILAALFSGGTCYFSEPELSRDHTERMLAGMGAEIANENGRVRIEPLKAPLAPLNFRVPADPSSGFFFAVAAAIVPGSEVVLKNVTLNPTRVEAYRVLERMGAKVEFVEKENRFEPVGDIRIAHGELRGVEVHENISWLIDELPALSIAMANAQGKSVVRGAGELRVKESDRIKSVVSNLVRCGVNAKELADGFEIEGGRPLKGATIDSYGDHRIAMSFSVAALNAEGEMTINESECIATSFPNFVTIFRDLGGMIEESELAD